MRLRRRPETVLEQVLPSGSPLDQCNQAIASTRAKADKNKRRSRACTWTLTLGTAAIPVLILLSTQFLSFWIGKFVPGLVAAALFVAASYTQLERPHERWNVYRRYQRTFEAERLLYQGGAAPYNEPDTRDTVFATKLAQLTVALHDDWARVLPTPDEVAGIGQRHS
jgi:Zn-dependent protease with chaperone function